MNENQPNNNEIFAHLTTDWLSAKFFKTFKIKENKSASDFIIAQREKKYLLSVHPLWDFRDEHIIEIENDLNQTINQYENSNIVWMPEKNRKFIHEQKNIIIEKIGKGIKGLKYGEYREIRMPIEVTLSKTEDNGSYIAINGALSKIWTKISSGVQGVFQLDGANYGRLPSELAEEKIIIDRIQEASKLLNVGEASFVTIDEYWPVNNVSAETAKQKIIIPTPSENTNLNNGPEIRKKLRVILDDVNNKESNDTNDKILLLLNSKNKHEDVVISSLKSINPGNFENIAMILIVNAGIISIVKKNDAINL
ncbi:MAG: hypothetical protein CL872_04010 [Dehalococcoidaceae bacterium]|nr:hypothetical protein [Dehalococcoidaceae bacterium]|tara:strand:+ start:33743 stop:34669 length:927 start_codon:yes stop_codon:yes gene_type:complete